MSNCDCNCCECGSVDEDEVEMYMKTIEGSIFGTCCDYMDRLVDYMDRLVDHIFEQL